MARASTIFEPSKSNYGEAHELLSPQILAHTQTCEINSESELATKPDMALSNSPGRGGPRAAIQAIDFAPKTRRLTDPSPDGPDEP